MESLDSADVRPTTATLRRRSGRDAVARVGIALLVGLLTLAAPATVAAHQLTGRFTSPIPLGAYLAAAALAVGASFAIVFVRGRGPIVVPVEPPAERIVRVPRVVRAALAAIGAIAWTLIVVQVAVGGRSEGDAASLFLWTYGWVGLALISAFIGPIWLWLDPFATLHRLGAAVLRRAGIDGGEPAAYPVRLGRWPAVVTFIVVVWMELALPATRSGRVLGFVLIAYSVITLVAMAQFGRETWRRNGEVFSVWFGLVGRLAPLARLAAGSDDGARALGAGAASAGRPDRLRVRSFAAGLLEPGAELAGLTLAALSTGAILFDGLSQTEAYFRWFGVPSVGEQTVLLLGWLAIVVGLALAVGRIVGVRPLLAGLIPIAIGYLIAHYLTFVLFDSQRIVLLVTDPLGLGWDVLGVGEFEPQTGWLPGGVAWSLQLVAVVGGHVIGAWAGHATALREVAGPDGRVSADDARGVQRRQIPLALLMVGLTALTLWSLGQTIVETASASTGTQSPSGRTSASRSTTSGSSASAAATAVSIAVRHRMPSAVAASRISAASRTAPDWGVGVLTTRRTSPDAMRSRIGTPSASSAAPYLETDRASWPRVASAAAVPAVAANR